MAADPVAVVAHMVDAYNARDIDRFLGCYSPDTVIEDGKGTVLRQGRQAMRAFYGQWRAPTCLRGPAPQLKRCGADAQVVEEWHRCEA